MKDGYLQDPSVLCKRHGWSLPANLLCRNCNGTSVVSGYYYYYYHSHFDGHRVSRYGNTNSRSIERERLSFVTFPGAATRGSNCWQTQSLSHISRELIGYVYQEHEIVSSPLAANLANSVISASCCVGLVGSCGGYILESCANTCIGVALFTG